MPLKLDQLVSTIAGAVIQAQHQVQQNHLGGLWRYFKEGTPVSVVLDLPRVDPNTGQQAPVKVSVPLITLVNQGQLAIDEMQVTMQVDLSEIAPAQAQPSPAAAAPMQPAEKSVLQPHEWKPQEYTAQVAASTTAVKQPGGAGMAQVTLNIKAGETPEGLARLLEHLNKCL